MAEHLPGSDGSRMGELLRRLTESAERHALARASLLASLRRVLAVEPDPAALLEAVAADRPALDSGLVLVRERDGWRSEVSLGISPEDSPEEVPVDGPISDALRTGAALQVHGAAVPSPLPPGTRSALILPFAPMRGDTGCVVLFGSRSRPSIDEADAIVAHVAGERLARLLASRRLDARAADAAATDRATVKFRDQVLAIVGHDLRNPLGAIVMSAALLQKKGDLSGWQARTVDRVRSSAARMGRIIDDLLSYTRTRLGGGIPVEPRPTDLGEVVDKIVEESRVAHPDAVLEIQRAGDLSGRWDAARLEQVISNLVSNAIDHGEERAPVEVGICADADRVELIVVNRGEIPSAVLEHAFEAFQRGPEQGGRKASGLGLGLYIAREIVRRHGGDIEARSGDGRTYVLLSLPRATGTDEVPVR